MARVSAARVRSGDVVNVRGEMREVKAVRSDQRGASKPDLTLVFKSGRPLRVNVTDELAVWRGDRELR
ncbi:hypothetical protein [Streptomyces gilvosporeus]|uniref:hypothetical protein n=1 Tax=Streptomyces gilvosporeus TaxID=553510 RepID=UPI00131B28DD|nr:hypothetical protein [Streptomyces gilvosporeus]